MKYFKIFLIVFLTLLNVKIYAQLEDEDKRIQRCKYLLETGRTDDAIKELSGIIETTPNYQKTYIYLGMAYSKKGQYDKALDAFKKAIEFFPDDKQILSNLGNTYTDLKMYDEAITVLKKVMEIDSGDVEAFINLGAAYAQKGNTEEAINLFRKAVSLSSNDPLARYNLGYSYYKIKKWNEAIDELLCLRFIDQWYRTVEETLTLASKDAIQDLTKQAKDKPADAMAHYYYAVALLYGYKYDLAEEEIDKAIKIDGTKGIFYAAKDLIISSRASANDEDKTDDEIKLLTQCINKVPDCWECYWQMSEVYLGLENPKKALVALQNALKINSGVINVYSYLGVAYARTDQHEEAVNAFTKAIKLGTEDPNTYYNLAYTYYKLKKYALAWYYARKAENEGFKKSEQLINDLKKVSKELN